MGNLWITISSSDHFETPTSRGVYVEGVLQGRKFRAVLGAKNWLKLEEVNATREVEEIHEEDKLANEVAKSLYEMIGVGRIMGYVQCDWKPKLRGY